MNHLMIDLETLGTTPDTAVVSLGAVHFNSGGIIDERCWIFSLTGQLDGRRRFATAQTITWWINQGDDARRIFEKSQLEGIYLKDFVAQFIEWCPKDQRGLRVWGNGASFDIPIIEDILRQQGATFPWLFWNHRCYRTMKACFGVDKKFEGTKHDALDDARHQAKCLIEYWMKNPGAEK
jgi:hypothetical protein